MGNQVDVWQYMREMESRMARMEKEHNDKISMLQTEITTLRAQLAQQHVNNTQAQQQGL
jgi:rubrerythrin